MCQGSQGAGFSPRPIRNVSHAFSSTKGTIHSASCSLAANPGDNSVAYDGFWNTQKVVRPILGAVAKRLYEVEYINVLDVGLCQFGTRVMDPRLIPCCRSDVKGAVWHVHVACVNRWVGSNPQRISSGKCVCVAYSLFKSSAVVRTGLGVDDETP